MPAPPAALLVRQRPPAAAAAAAAPPRRRGALRPVALHKQYALNGAPPPSAPRAAAAALPATPEGVVLECLTALRRGALAELEPFLPAARLAAPGAPVLVAGVPVQEAGPLARCAPLMDAAARRALPGHLLRRARVLSVLTHGGSSVLRVALTACTGEELVLTWRLGLVGLPGIASGPAAQPAAEAAAEPAEQQRGGPSAADRSGGGSGSGPAGPGACCWQVLSCERDASGDDDALPAAPHPRAPPELVVLGQLAALRRGDAVAAAGFNMLGRHAGASGWDAHLAAWRQLLARPRYGALCAHAATELGASALPSQRLVLQEVLLRSAPGGRPPERFLWRLGMASDGCWAVRAIEALPSPPGQPSAMAARSGSGPDGSDAAAAAAGGERVLLHASVPFLAKRLAIWQRRSDLWPRLEQLAPRAAVQPGDVVVASPGGSAVDELRRLRAAGAAVVGVAWLESCLAAGERAPHAPHALSLDAAAAPQARPAAKRPLDDASAGTPAAPAGKRAQLAPQLAAEPTDAAAAAAALQPAEIPAAAAAADAAAQGEAPQPAPHFYAPRALGRQAAPCPDGGLDVGWMPADALRVVSYNVLADCFIGSKAYCPQRWRAWPGRWARLAAELEAHRPHILALQEVDEPLWAADVAPWLARAPLEMTGRFRAREREPLPGGAPGAPPGQPRDGVALLWSAARFELLAERSVRFADHLPAGPPALAGFWREVGRQEEGALLALLRDKQTGRPLLAVCTHLWWQPAHPHVKSGQAHVLCEVIAAFAAEHAAAAGGGGPQQTQQQPAQQKPEQQQPEQQEPEQQQPEQQQPEQQQPEEQQPEQPEQQQQHPGPLPLVICGDFNSLWRNAGAGGGGDGSDDGGSGDGGGADGGGGGGDAAVLHTSGLCLRSAHMAACGHEPPLTNKHPGFSGCLDYIWVGSPGSPGAPPSTSAPLDVLGVLAVPYETVGRAVPHNPAAVDFPFIPNAAWPSDHLAIGAALRLA
ncbi:ccr4 [Scenedesmus sp. PABB004]|nr:ccr4 [Scenedesmus sp. PABB004]